MSNRPRRYRSDLNFLMEKHLREAGIEIPFPQRDINFRNALKVEMDSVGQDRPSESGREDGSIPARSTSLRHAGGEPRPADAD